MEAPEITERTTEDGQLQWHISRVHVWEKLNRTRTITANNFAKLKDDLTLNGVEDELIIDSEGTIYDGKNRFNAVNNLIENGTPKSQKGHDLSWLPVKVVPARTEAEKWRIALRKAGHYATWDADELNNFIPEFENDLDLNVLNIEFRDPRSIEETLTALENEYQKAEDERAEAKEKSEVNENVQTTKVAHCPNCGHEFEI